MRKMTEQFKLGTDTNQANCRSRRTLVPRAITLPVRIAVVQVFVMSLVLIMRPLPSFAAAPSSALWAKIDNADGRIHSSHTVWIQTHRELPDPSANPDLAVAQIAAQEQQKGVPKAEMESLLALVRRHNLEMQVGRTVLQKLDFQFNGRAMRGQLELDAWYGPRTPPLPPQIKGHIIAVDLYDGKNNIGVDVSGKAQLGWANRDPANYMVRTAHLFGDTMFLIGTPVMQSFPQSET